MIVSQKGGIKQYFVSPRFVNLCVVSINITADYLHKCRDKLNKSMKIINISKIYLPGVTPVTLVHTESHHSNTWEPSLKDVTFFSFKLKMLCLVKTIYS